jgi:hypothetical protein
MKLGNGGKRETACSSRKGNIQKWYPLWFSIWVQLAASSGTKRSFQSAWGVWGGREQVPLSIHRLEPEQHQESSASTWREAPSYWWQTVGSEEVSISRSGPATRHTVCVRNPLTSPHRVVGCAQDYRSYVAFAWGLWQEGKIESIPGREWSRSHFLPSCPPLFTLKSYLTV